MQIERYNFFLPDEALVKCFSYLDLDDLPTLGLVCETWNRVSGDEQFWIPIAKERMINLRIDKPTMRAKVLCSFSSYCRAARWIFPITLANVPDERRLIDAKLKERIHLNMDQIGIKPTPVLERTSAPSTIIEKHIPFFQAALYWNIQGADATFESVVLSDRHLEVPQFNMIVGVWESFGLEKVIYTGSLVPEYLSTYVKKPSTASVFALCSGHVFITWTKALESRNVGHIEYPEFIHDLIKKMDEKEFLALLETSHFMKPLRMCGFSLNSKIFDPATVEFQNCLTGPMMESYRRSLLSIRNPRCMSTLPGEILNHCFSHLQLTDRLSVERVCKTWQRNLSWKEFAIERKIPVEGYLIRAQVMTSLKAYYSMARQFFPTNPFIRKPFKSPIIQFKCVLRRLEEDLDELNANQLISLAQVMLHSKAMNADALLQAAVGAYFNQLQSPMMAFMNKSTNIPLIEIAYVLPQYIAPYVENPCGDAVHFLCISYAVTAWLNNVTIEYPPYMHHLIKKLDEAAFEKLFNTSNFLSPFLTEMPEETLEYQFSFKPEHQPLLESYKESVLAIRKKSLVEKVCIW